MVWLWLVCAAPSGLGQWWLLVTHSTGGCRRTQGLPPLPGALLCGDQLFVSISLHKTCLGTCAVVPLRPASPPLPRKDTGYPHQGQAAPSPQHMAAGA